MKKHDQPITNHARRRFLKKSSLVAASLGVAQLPLSAAKAEEIEISPTKLKGNINHSVCRWCYGRVSLDDLCKAAVSMGITGIDLVGPKEWPTLKKYGLTCAMANGAGMGITRGFNRTEYHDQLVADFESLIHKAAAAGFKNVICFPGNRDGLDDEAGLKNCATGLKRLLKIAEQNKITLVMELLNSKVDHKDYQADHTAWGVKLCKMLGSDNFKLLYDIYHMQIMEGDVIRTIKENAPYIAHYHTGGVPGRNEIDETQELYYPAIMKAIVETGFKGFVAQEFKPRNEDPLTSLRKSIQICDV